MPKKPRKKAPGFSFTKMAPGETVFFELGARSESHLMANVKARIYMQLRKIGYSGEYPFDVVVHRSAKTGVGVLVTRLDTVARIDTVAPVAPVVVPLDNDPRGDRNTGADIEEEIPLERPAALEGIRGPARNPFSDDYDED